MNRNQNIQILTTLNQAYLPRLQVMLTSMHSSQPDERFDIWLLHNSIPGRCITASWRRFCCHADCTVSSTWIRTSWSSTRSAPYGKQI